MAGKYEQFDIEDPPERAPKVLPPALKLQEAVARAKPKSPNTPAHVKKPDEDPQYVWTCPPRKPIWTCEQWCVVLSLTGIVLFVAILAIAKRASSGSDSESGSGGITPTPDLPVVSLSSLNIDVIQDNAIVSGSWTMMVKAAASVSPLAVLQPGWSGKYGSFFVWNSLEVNAQLVSKTTNSDGSVSTRFQMSALSNVVWPPSAPSSIDCIASAFAYFKNGTAASPVSISYDIPLTKPS